MKLIVITTPTFFVEEDKIIAALFEEGLDILHLRKPDTASTYSERLLTLIPEQYHNQIVTHDHFYLKDEYNLKGIHLNSRNPHEPNEYKGSVSCSCHSLEEVNKKKNTCEYVFMSPIFNSISKEKYHSGYSLREIKQAVSDRTIDKKVMALGGICLENILQIKALDFGGAVVLGDLWKHFDTRNNVDYKEIINHFIKLKRLSE